MSRDLGSSIIFNNLATQVTKNSPSADPCATVSASMTLCDMCTEIPSQDTVYIHFVNIFIKVGHPAEILFVKSMVCTSNKERVMLCSALMMRKISQVDHVCAIAVVLMMEA